MLYLAAKAALSGVLIAVISDVAKRHPGAGGLIASLPLVSVLGMIWLWRDFPDPNNMAAHVESTFWFVLPSLPMFLIIPALLRHGFGFWGALAIGCALTILLYGLMTWAGPRFVLRLYRLYAFTKLLLLQGPRRALPLNLSRSTPINL